MVPATSCLVGAGGSGMVPPVALQPACSSARLPIETGYGSGVGGCQSGSGAGSSGVNTGVGTLSGTGGSSGGQPSQSTASVPNPLAAMFAVAAAVQQQQHSQQQQQTHMRLPQPLASGAPGGGLNPAEMAALLLGGQSIRMQAEFSGAAKF
ncbi:unnamed protein product [Protopolystoma xenopodis]|uniref:Uncharacterized protein n=1 Tax=Protopolystoma xenopodis TaxID=117903 RepID=A0A3S5FEV1_9PLAT|nr:unnamed protein product [Protopolystoma xenopodis]